MSAQSETLFSFLFDLSDITTAPYYLVLEINSSVFGEENVDDSNWNEVDGIMIGSKNVDVRSPAVSDDESTDWIPYLLIAGLVIIVLYLTKSKSRRPGAPF